MKWDAEALSMIEGAPPAIQPMIRRKIEAMAAGQGASSVSRELVASLVPARHGAAPSGNTDRSRPPQTLNIERHFAREGVDPLTGAFDVTGDVHVFAGGRPLTREEAAQQWEAAERSRPSQECPRCLYIHVPFCRSRCVFCPFYANRWTPESSGTYADALVCEIERLGQTPLGSARFDAVYFGGGTPSDLAPRDVARILEAIRGHLVLAADAEVTLEGRVWGHGPDTVSAAVDNGVNRFSIGVQTFDTALRQSLGRRANRQEVLAFLDSLANHPVTVVIDLIYGLPGQSAEMWLDDLRRLIGETRVHGVDLYRLKTVPGAAMDDLVASGRLPEPPKLPGVAAMFSAGNEAMQQAGWERLSVPHWRRDACERSRYNTLIKAGADCVPLGCGAGGRVGATRFFQASGLEAYHADVRQGRKPVASGVGLDGNHETIDTISAQLDSGQLDTAAWPGASTPLRQAAGELLAQWSRAGLLQGAGPSYALSTAGQFWNVQMGVRLAKLAQDALGP